ncbi:MAG TPA: GNAT family N-acetyltransferase [Symbiobacteriaceae bacterium]
MTIRPLIPADVHALQAMCQRQETCTWCGEDLAEMTPDSLPPEELAYVAVEGGEILAYIQFRLSGTFGRSAAVTRLVVRKDGRGKGAERRILEYVEEMILPRGKDLFLLCPAGNAEARRFCEAMGYRACGELEEYPRPGEAQVIYRKRADQLPAG